MLSKIINKLMVALSVLNVQCIIQIDTFFKCNYKKCLNNSNMIIFKRFFLLIV